MVYEMIKHKNKKVLAYMEPWMQANWLNNVQSYLKSHSLWVTLNILTLVYQDSSKDLRKPHELLRNHIPI